MRKLCSATADTHAPAFASFGDAESRSKYRFVGRLAVDFDRRRRQISLTRWHQRACRVASRCLQLIKSVGSCPEILHRERRTSTLLCSIPPNPVTWRRFCHYIRIEGQEWWGDGGEVGTLHDGDKFEERKYCM